MLLFAEVDALGLEAAVPGIVCALTTAKTPTPRNAAMVLPTVSRSSSRSAWSRDLARARVTFEGSMLASLAEASKPCLRGGWEVPERVGEGGEYTLIDFNGSGSRWSRNSPVARWRRARAGRTESESDLPAPVAQWIEQDGPNVKVGGSIPSGGALPQ